jgi:PIN domain nuclease of toxin-antitoxin system
MKVLLDSHIFLWLAESPTRLSSEAAMICRSTENILLLSIASLWEIQIKAQLGRLQLNLPLHTTLYEQQRVNKIELLPITPQHIFTLSQLADHHRDPFDRILIAQGIFESLPILSHDHMFTSYPVKVIW